jgi:hypothetical protein
MTDTHQTSVEDTSQVNPPETVTETTANINSKHAEDTIDYKTKFSESSKEALRLLEETRAKDAEIERLRTAAESGTSYGNNSDALYPGFENLDDEAQKNLLAYTNSIKKNTLDEVYKDPAIAFAKQSYNERVWSEAFDGAVSEFPELKDSQSEFKQKYFKADNVPTNIKDILKDLAKVHLFDKARDIGAKQAKEQAERIDIERAKGGDKTPTASRTLEDWNQMAKSNPAEFAKNSKQFNEELASGKLK